MKLIECYIENFGKLSKMKVDFSDGLNCILGDNGSGKTTLSVFIKVMLFGMTDTKKVSLDENDRKRYMPWQGGTFGGSLTFEAGGKIYRVERSFGSKASDDTFALFDTELGRESSDFTKNLGEELFAIDADGFERTVFLSEKSLSPKSDNKTISAKLSDLVGCDGDIGVMDEALKLLDTQRKFYYKKGGSGEISEIKAKISALDEKIAVSTLAGERVKEAEKRIAELSQVLHQLRLEERLLSEERERAAVKVAEESYKEALRDMNVRLEKAEARRGEILKIFKGNPPTQEEIDIVLYKSNEAAGLREGLKNEESEEFVSLNGIFSGEDIPEKTERLAAALEREKNPDTASEKKRKSEIFSKRLPSYEEVKGTLDNYTKKEKKNYLPMCFGTALILIGAACAFINPLLLLISAVGAAVIILSAIKNTLGAKKDAERRRAEAVRFLSSVSKDGIFDSENPESALREMLALLSDESVAVDSESDILRGLVRDFNEDDGDIIASAARILEKYRRYTELCAVERYKAQSRENSKNRITALENEINSFIARFEPLGDEPLSKMRVLILEYSKLCEDIVTRRKDITNISSKQLIGEGDGASIRSTEQINERAALVSEKIRQTSQDITLAQRQCREDEDAFDLLDELTARRAELLDLYDTYTENLETVRLTEKFLGEAKDSMTAKYLGKTKAGFEKYAALISGEDGSYEMSTSFAVSKSEGAKTHPTEAYSRGVRDLFDLAARLALIDSLYENERPFIILDDPLTAFDDKRCEAAISIIKSLSKERQIIYFTCSSSRAAQVTEALDKSGKI